MLSTIASITSIISAVGVIIGIFIAIAQLKKTAKIAEADHSRRRKEATIMFYDEIRERTRPLTIIIKKISGDDPVTVKQIKEHPKLESSISRYLSLMERLAVGISSDVFDYEVYRELNKTVTIKHFHMFREYIVSTRTKNCTPRFIIHFERLVRRLEDDPKTDLPDISVKRP